MSGVLEYEPIRPGERYVRRWSWRCWCLQPVKQRLIKLLQVGGDMAHKWIDG